MTTREILTLQLGHYSNFIGTHWWNLQESNFSYDADNPSEINPEVLYREGETPQRQVTFTPRLLLVDLKGSLGYLSHEGTLYDTPQSRRAEALLWDKENVEVTKEEKANKGSFIQHLENPTESTEEPVFDLENETDSWVDFLYTRYHPRTVNVVKEYTHNDTSCPFNAFTFGRNLWDTKQFTEDFTERIRSYVEECDLMQGFQVLMDSTDGFSGLGVSCVQYLKDEYGKSILCFPCVDSKGSEPSVANLTKAINTAFCWQSIGEHSSLYSPLCCGETGWLQPGNSRKFDHLTYDPDLRYHSSAVLATALDTLSIRYRRREYPGVSMSDLCADLNKMGRKAAATSLSLPFPMTVKTDLIDVLDEMDGPLWTSLTPSCEIPMDKNMQSIVLRGVTEERLKRPVQDAGKQLSKPAYRCSTVHEMMSLYLACNCHASATYLSNVKAGLKIKTPYPRIFDKSVTETGDIAGWPVGTDVRSVPVMAGLHSGGSLADMYDSLHSQLARVRNIKKFHVFTDSGLEEDEFKECVEHLLDCKEAYEDHYV